MPKDPDRKRKKSKSKPVEFGAPTTPESKADKGERKKKKKQKTHSSASSSPNLPTSFQTRHLVNGQWVPGKAGRTFDTVNPATGRVITQVCEGDSDDVDMAVKAARAALPQWKKVAPREKGKILFRLAELMEKHREELAVLESLDNGKPKGEAYSVDLNLAINTIRYYAGWADKIHGKVIPLDPPNLCFTKREPVGVIGQIIPWNFPICMAAWKIGPGLAGGNCLILKPAENTPLTALRLGELACEAGVPPGVLNIVNGYGNKAGQALVDHPDVDKLAFTGSSKIGKMIAQSCGAQLKRTSLELGGKSPLFICDDADLDKAVDIVQIGLFLNQGQCCCASSRVFCHEAVYEQFVAKCAERARSRQLGDPFDPSTTQGPQISQQQMDTILGYIESGKREGAKLVTGGARHGNQGFFVQPTIFADVKDSMTIAKEEIFGPVMSIMKFSDLGEAIKRGNKSRYGLAAGVITNNMKKAMQVVDEMDAGTIWVNTYDVLHEAAPFGGFKDSGIGRELGEAALDLYTELKTVTIDKSVG